MSFLKKSNGNTLRGHASKKFSFSSGVLALATFASLITFAATPAHADYNDAKIQYESLPAETQYRAVIGLISSGDFNGFAAFGFNERLYKAILAYETRNNLKVDGKLQPWEISRVESETDILLNQVGFTDYKNSEVGSILWVPRKLFDSEIAIDNGISFQRIDKGYSLSFVAHTNEQSTFENLFDVIRTPSNERSIAYQKIRDNFFVVTGANKGRNFYTFMERIPAGTTGFTLTYKAENSVLGGKLSTILANTFISTPKTEKPAAEPEQPQTVAVTQDEAIVEASLATPTSAVPVTPNIAVPVVAVVPTIAVPQPPAMPVVQVAANAPQQSLDPMITAPVSGQANPTTSLKAEQGDWQHSESKDLMRNETTHSDFVFSPDKLDFNFPYDGGSTISLFIRHKNFSTKSEILLMVSKGAFTCNVYRGDTLAVKFDDGPVHKYKCSTASDGMSDGIFIESAPEFMAKLRASSKVTIEADFFQEGTRQFSFTIGGYKPAI